MQFLKQISYFCIIIIGLDYEIMLQGLSIETQQTQNQDP